jgi:hypothetical protein
LSGIGDWVLLKNLVSFGCSGSNGNWCTVHVHLTVTDLVEPSPGDDCVSSWDIWDWESVLGWGWGASVVTGVSCNSLNWATSLDGVDDLEDGVLGWDLVVGD